MKTHSDFLAAVAATIGKNPDLPSNEGLAAWEVNTNFGILHVLVRHPGSARIHLQFRHPLTRVEELGASVFDGRWDIALPALNLTIEEARQAAVAELSKRLARVGFVPQSAPLPGNDTGIPDDEPQGEPATGLGQLPITDAEINEITADVLGPWPSFEAQSWACKVAKAVLAARAEQTGIAADYNRVANPVLVPEVFLVNSADQPFPGLRVLEIRATDEGLRVALEQEEIRLNLAGQALVFKAAELDVATLRKLCDYYLEEARATDTLRAKPMKFTDPGFGFAPDKHEKRLKGIGECWEQAENKARGYQAVVDAAREFVAKVERGKARSKRSYAAFKEALKLIDGAPVSPVRYFRNPKTGKEWRVAPGERVKYRIYSPEASEWRKSASDLEMLEAGDQFQECNEHGNPLTGGKEGQ